MKKINWKDVGRRALKTFIQAMIAALVADGTMLTGSLSNFTAAKHVLMTALVGAVAAGVSAVWNTVVSPILAEEEKSDG